MPPGVSLSDFYYILPELVLTGGALLVLVADVLLPKERRAALAWVTLLALAATAAALVPFASTHIEVAHGLLAVDQFSLTTPPEPEVYVSYQQLPTHIMSRWTEARIHKNLIVRTHSASKALMQGVRRTISELAPESAVFGISMVEQTVSKSAGLWRFLCQILELVALIALILALVGIYGVISYSVGERTHELGLRMALGAQPNQILGLVLRQAMVLSLIGVAIGLAGSFAATPLLAEFLYGVKAYDVPTLVLVSSLLMAVTFAASYVPARHATKIDPMRTLRQE
jgi:putative ABC transport system permease protein